MEFQTSFHGHNHVNIKLVHEFLDTLKLTIMKDAADYDAALEAREMKKRQIAGMKDMPTNTRQQHADLQARAAAAREKSRMSE